MKNSKSIAALLVLLCSFGQHLYAQDVAVNTSNPAMNAAYSSSTETKIVAITTMPDSKLIAKFSTKFPVATNQQWKTAGAVYHVSFMNNGRNVKAVFTLKGNLNYAITACSLEQLPEAFRKNISSNYPGYTLLQGTEINAYDTLAWQAVLENAMGYITLKATSDSIEEVQVQKKGK